MAAATGSIQPRELRPATAPHPPFGAGSVVSAGVGGVSTGAGVVSAVAGVVTSAGVVVSTAVVVCSSKEGGVPMSLLSSLAKYVTL